MRSDRAAAGGPGAAGEPDSGRGGTGQLIVLSGLSGAGKTTAMHALEDIGYFVTDNVPPSLWPALVERLAVASRRRAAVSIDVRARTFLDEVEAALAAAAELGWSATVLFLTASEATLVQRYNLTRRTHPLAEGTLSSDIASERQALEPLRSLAERVVDTTGMSASELTLFMWRTFGEERAFRLRLVSFGFKRGAPIDADMVLDVRALPNPFYDEKLKGLGGTDPRVSAHVFTPAGLELYTQFRNLTRNVAALARDAGRSGYTVAIGCTGGQHRSVAVVDRLCHDLAEQFDVQVEHRDLPAALAERQG